MRTSWRLLGSRGRLCKLPLCHARQDTSESPAPAVLLPERFREGFAPSAPPGRLARWSLPRGWCRLATKLPAAMFQPGIPKVWCVTYPAAEDRYETMTYRRAGRSGLKLPAISLGLWHNFGDGRPWERQRDIVRRAFDLGVTHFDLANNYGPPPGSAESNFGRLLATDLRPYRDELVISTKAGYHMWEGPYGEWGSRKYLVSSLDQSLTRLGPDYVDIFYHHRPDPDTPIEETMTALDA